MTESRELEIRKLIQIVKGINILGLKLSKILEYIQNLDLAD